MKNKWVRGITGISVIALCLGAGYWLGSQRDTDRLSAPVLKVNA